MKRNFLVISLLTISLAGLTACTGPSPTSYAPPTPTHAQKVVPDPDYDDGKMDAPPPAVTPAGPDCVNAPGKPAASADFPCASREGMVIQVTGSCKDPYGFRLYSRGLLDLSIPDPRKGFIGEQYWVIDFWGPDGKRLTERDSWMGSDRDASGDTPQWRFDCRSGPNGLAWPPGRYTLRVYSSNTKHNVTTTFVVTPTINR